MEDKYSNTNPFAPIKKASQEEPSVYGAAEGTSDHEPWDVPDATPSSDPAPQRVDGGSHNAEWVTQDDKPTSRFSDAGEDDHEPLAADTDGSNDAVSDKAVTPGDGESGAADENQASSDEEVPDGTTKDVLEWVGDDKDRAQRALDVEEGKSNGGRVGLKRDLNDMLEN